jgi:hypothetical protein
MRVDKFGKLIKKLSSGKFGELADRLCEEMRRREERRVYRAGRSAFDTNHPDKIFTTDFLQRFVSHDKHVDFVAALRTHTDTEFMPGFALRSKFRGFVETVQPSERSRIIATAEQIIADKFPVFNLGFISYGDSPRWNYDPIHKVTAPECFYGDIDYLDPSIVGDSKVVWEISRFQFVYDLGQAYLLTGDEKYPRKFFELVHNWRQINRDYHGVNFCSALESAFRIHALAWGIWFFKDSPSLTNECTGDLYGLIYSCADFVRHHLSKYFSPNTHLFGEAYALMLAGILFSEFSDAPVWEKLGHDTILPELNRQFTVGGMHAELSTAYHGYAVEFLLSLVALCRQRNIPLEERFHERLKQGYDVLTALQRPDGTWPHIGDEDGGRLFFLSRVPASDFRPLLESCRYFLSPEQSTNPRRYVDSFWLSGVTEEGSKRAGGRDLNVPDVMSEFHSPIVKGDCGGYDSGIIVSRSPNGMYSVFQCGPFGHLDSPHSHADMLHLDISVGADNFLVDPGTYVYTADLDTRSRYRSAAVHNGPTIALLPLENPRDPFGWLQKPNCRMKARYKTERSDFYRAEYKVNMDRHIATISRSVLFLHDMFWVICDSIDTSTPCQLLWNFVTPCSVALQKNNTCVLQGKAGRLALIPCVPVGDIEAIDIAPFDFSDDYLSTRHGHRIRVASQSFGLTSYAFIVLPFQHYTELPEQVDILSDRGGLTVKLIHGKTTTLISRANIKQSEMDTDTDFAFIQLSDQTLQRAVIAGGSRVKYKSSELLRTRGVVEYADIIREAGGYRTNATGPVELITPSPIRIT